MKKIKLGNNRCKLSKNKIAGWAIVDDEDYFFVSWYAWNLSTGGYAYATDKGKKFGMAHFVLGFISKLPCGVFIDHINGNRLDNRKSNLRLANKSQNGANRGLPVNNKSGYKGVYKCSTTGRWRAEIMCKGKTYKLGRFNDIIEAAKAYDKKAVELFGQFAKTNL